MPEVLLRSRRCNACQSMFCVCSHCDRGQRYCSDPCREYARRQQRRAANRRHQQTEHGREAHKLRQRAYRRRRYGSPVTDQGYGLAQATPSDRHSDFSRCTVCGRVSAWIELYRPFRRRRRNYTTPLFESALDQKTAFSDARQHPNWPPEVSPLLAESRHRTKTPDS